MWYVCKIHTYTYNNGYAQHTSMCISHMHSAYLICTWIYLHVCACICMYWVFYELYPVHMSMYVLTRQCSYSMIQSDMHITRSAYLHVFECILSLHTYRYALILMCISVRIWLYSVSVYIQICTCCHVHIWMYLNVFCSYKHAHMHSSRCAYVPVSDCMFLRNTCTYIKMGGWFYCAKSAVRRRMKISRVAPGRVATHADGTGVPRARKWQAPKTSRASATRALTTSRSRAGLVAWAAAP